MNLSPFPKTRLKRLAIDVASHNSKLCKSIFDGDKYRNYESIRKIVENLGVFLVADQSIPGESKQGVTMLVDNTEFIVLDKNIANSPEVACNVLAHELGHIALGHLKRFNSAHCFTEAITIEDGELQLLLSLETEVEAEIFAWLTIIPDGLLHKEVESTIWIKTNVLADTHNLPRDWLHARVSLYRLMYGFDRSLELLRKRPRNYFSFMPDPIAKLASEEGNSVELMLEYFPKVDSKILGYIM